MKSDLSIQAVAWFLLTAVCLLFVLAGLKAALKRTGWERKRQEKIFFATTVILLLWATMLLALSYRGFFADFSIMPPRPGLAIIIPLPVVLIIAFSKKGTQLLKSLPEHWLVYLQSFRIIVELLLLSAFIAGKLPVQMTYEGRNFDIMTGVLAIPVGYLLANKRPYAAKLAIAFNIVGMILLLNILVIAVLSMPTPMRHFMNEPANTLVAQFPFILLPGILVPLAYSLHIFSLRQLFARHRSEFESVRESLITDNKATKIVQ
jgi:hypothetical protein